MLFLNNSFVELRLLGSDIRLASGRSNRFSRRLASVSVVGGKRTFTNYSRTSRAMSEWVRNLGRNCVKPAMLLALIRGAPPLPKQKLIT